MSDANPPITEEATFKSGREVLFRRVLRPAAPPWARLALCHGYGEHSGRHLPFLRWLAERGVECHALDLRGQGRSTGRRGYVTRWEEYVEDFTTFLQEIRFTGEGPDGPPRFLLGHSHGALVVLAAVLQGLPGTSGLVLTAPYLRSCMEVPRWKRKLAYLVNPIFPTLALPSGLKEDWMSSDPEMVRDSREDALNVRVATVRWYVTAHAEQARLFRRAPELRLPLLVLTGGADPISDPQAVREFVQAAGSADKTLEFYPDLLHELFREACREELFATTLAWLRRHATA